MDSVPEGVVFIFLLVVEAFFRWIRRYADRFVYLWDLYSVGSLGL